MAFSSILFAKTDDCTIKETHEAPECFADLNLDQIVDAVTDSRKEYNLKPFFYAALNNIDTIKYRQEIMQDLENKILFARLQSFAQKMCTMRRYRSLADKLDYRYHKEGWFLETVELYCEAVDCLTQDLTHIDLTSRGLLAFREYMTDYVNSERFTSLVSETKKLKADLSAIKYCLLIKGNAITVCKFKSEIDYSAEVEKTFEKFKQGAVKNYKVEIPAVIGMNHIEAQILKLVAKLYPAVFSNLINYCALHGDFLDQTIAIFDREIQFYLAYLEYLEPLKQAGLKFCYPQLSDTSKEISVYESFDLALAHKLHKGNSSVVCNDFYLRDMERLVVVSGPNQGGKTTFARTFGQLHYLASIGCPIPGRKAQLFLFDNLFTHFEKEENIKDLHGKLEDDLIRILHILSRATPSSIIIINEMFTSTTLEDAIFLSKEIMGKILQLDVLCIWVTFIDELASLSEKNVSMVSTVIPDNPEVRTFKIVRRPADGLSYALSIAEKYGLTYNRLKERIKS